jgi:hypothetical protein
MKAPSSTLIDQLPEVRLVGQSFWFHFGTGCFPVVAGLAGCTQIVPGAFAALTDRMHVIQCGCLIRDFTATVLASVCISQEDITF